MENEILTFLKTNTPKLCVLATVNSESQPECAVMAYVAHDDFSVTISTHESTRKWINIKNNNKVALTFGFDHGKLNIQYEGTAEEVAQGPDHQFHEETYFKEHPYLKKFQTPDTKFIKVTGHWVRLTDLSQHPPRVEEKKL
jgi:general stress protein 26